MALNLNKFILPDGAPASGVQITQSSSVGPSDLWDFGVYNYVHSGSQGTSFFGGTEDLENNNSGSGSFVSSPDLGPSDLWNTATNRFDFSSLSVGDMIDIFVELEVDPYSQNQDFKLWIELGLGGTTRIVNLLNYSQQSGSSYFISTYKGIYLKDSNDINNPARIRYDSNDRVAIDSCSFYCKLIRKGRTS